MRVRIAWGAALRLMLLVGLVTLLVVDRRQVLRSTLKHTV